MPQRRRGGGTIVDAGDEAAATVAAVQPRVAEARERAAGRRPVRARDRLGDLGRSIGGNTDTSPFLSWPTIW